MQCYVVGFLFQNAPNSDIGLQSCLQTAEHEPLRTVVFTDEDGGIEGDMVVMKIGSFNPFCDVISESDLQTRYVLCSINM